MSNDLTTIDFTKQQVASKFAHLNAEDDNLADGLSSSYGVIGIKGKTWTLKKGGDKKFFVRPDDGTPAAHIDVVILGQARGKSRAYYLDYQDAQSEGKRPLCASLHGVVPDVDVEQKQSETCGLCPRNKRILNPETGKQTTECRENKRLAVLLLPAQTARMFDNQPLMEPVFLRVPAASLSNLAKFGDFLTGKGIHYASVITRISFDPTKAYQLMVFKAVQLLTDDEADTVLGMMNDPLVERITGGDEPQEPRGTQTVLPPPQQAAAPQPAPAPAPAPQPAPAPAPAAIQTAVHTDAPPAATEKPLSTGFAKVAEFASPSSLTLAPAPASNGAAFAVAPTPPATAAPADSGPATAATAELDAQIAALMPNKPVG